MIRYYKKCYELNPTGPMAEESRFYEIFKRTYYDNIAETRGLITKFQRDYPKSKYLPALENELNYMKNNEADYLAAAAEYQAKKEKNGEN